MAIPDEAAIACMRLLAEDGIEAGESGVAGLAGCLLAPSDGVTRDDWPDDLQPGPHFQH